MRNWHKKLIRTFTTSQNGGINSDSSPNIVIGLIDERYLEFARVNKTSTQEELNIPDYFNVHESFGNLTDTSPIRVFFRRPDNGNTFSQTLPIKTVESSGWIRTHAIGASGTIVGKEINNSLIEGIAPNSTLIYAYKDEDVFILSGTNLYTNNNLKSIYFKNNSVSKLVEKDTLIPTSPLVSDAYSDLKSDIISLSYNPDYNTKYAKFMMEELFSYGRKGRGTIVINSAGNGKLSNLNNQNLSKSFKTIMIGASNFDTTDFNIHPSNYDIITNIKEIKTEYSNYGDRLDLCAPSSPEAEPKINSLGIYAPTITFGGEVGNPEDYIEKKVIGVRNLPDSKITVLKLENTQLIFSGQAVELGDPNSFGNEIRFIKEVNYENNEIKIDERYYTRNAGISKIKILLSLKKVRKSSDVGDNNKLINESDNKGMKREQEVYVYAKNSLNSIGVYSKFKKTKIINFIATTKIELEAASLDLFNDSDDLYIVLGQNITNIKSKGGGFYSYVNIDGFFEGQLIYIREKNYVTNITRVDKGGQIFLRMINLEKETDLTIEW